ncbi:MAG: hypothetical protein ABGZ17_04885 [Planctomycetaceae bacterium]
MTQGLQVQTWKPGPRNEEIDIGMLEPYDQHGISFRYPTDWELDEQSHEDGLTITVSSSESVFWSISLFPTRPPPDHVLQTALAAFRQEYPELDESAVETELCDAPAWGWNLEFVCLDLINIVVLRAFRTGRFTALVLFQGMDRELELVREQVNKITDSLFCEFGDDVIIH